MTVLWSVASSVVKIVETVVEIVEFVAATVVFVEVVEFHLLFLSLALLMFLW